MELDTIYRGDCLDILSETFTSLHQVFADYGVGLPRQFADLIFMDPPFFSNRIYEKPWKDTKIGFTDNEWGYNLAGLKGKYLPYMKDRIQKCHDILKQTGSFYLHCDWHAGHYLKQVCDDIFGYNNFRNEITWCYSGRENPRQRMFARKHDTIFLYTKTKEYTFNVQYKPYREKYVEQFFKNDDEDGKGLYQLQPDGRGGKYKQYLNESKGQPINDSWIDIKPLNNRGSQHEALGYPTQKPEALLERIIKASSNSGEIILDPFCGCGTTLATAHKFGRHFIGIDLSLEACNIMKKRLEEIGAKSEVKNGIFTVDELKKMPAFNFQDYIIEICLKGISNIKKTRDMGIDGYTKEGSPIQVKQCKIQRTDIENFESALDRHYTNLGNEDKTKKGLIIGEGIPPDSVFAEITRIKEQRNIIIEFIGMQECCNILNERWTYMGRQEGWDKQKHLGVVK